MKQKLDAAHPFWFGTVAMLLTSALGYYTYRRKQTQCSAAFSAAQDAEVDRLVRAMNEDPTWWNLPPDDEMVRVINKIVEIRNRLPELSDELKPSANQAMERLQQVLIQLDIVRRMQVNVDPSAIEDPVPETWRNWAAGLVGSRRVAGATRFSTRMLYRLNALLLIVGLIGLQSVGVDRVIQDRIISLSDMVVRLDNLDGLEKELALAEADAKEEAPAPSRNLRTRPRQRRPV